MAALLASAWILSDDARRHRHTRRFMRTFLSSLLAVALLGHALVDCHAFQVHFCSHDEPATDLLADGSCEHALNAGDCDHSPVPCDCEVRCVGGCSYVPSQKTRLDASHIFASWDVATVPIASPNDSIANPHQWQGADRWGSATPPPLRLHLLHQLLLI
jgi:hypothetical protein